MSTHTLTQLMETPKGMKFTCGIGCSYSADDHGMESMKKSLNIYLDSSVCKQFEDGKIMRLYLQQGHSSESAHNCIRAYKQEKGCLHAKLYVMKYESSDGKSLVRCICSSGNLTRSDELNVYFCIESEKCASEETDLGRKLSDFFYSLGNDLSDKLSDFLKEIRKRVFVQPNNCELYTVSEAVMKKMLCDANNSEERLIVSPFVTANIIKKLQPTALISREDEMDSIAAVLKKKNVECKGIISDTDDKTMDLSDCLHAKMYIFTIKKDGQEKSIVWLGSANATYAAFHENIETLVRYETSEKDLIKNIKEMFDPYTPDDQGGDGKGKKKFESICVGILNSWDDAAYGILGSIEPGYQLKLNGIPSADGRWMRTMKARHTATLEIAHVDDENIEHKKSFSLQIPGDDIPIDQEVIEGRCEEALSDMIASVIKKGNSSQETESKNKKKETIEKEDHRKKKITLEEHLMDCVETDNWKRCEILKTWMEENAESADDDTKKVFEQAICALNDAITIVKVIKEQKNNE